MQLCVEKQLHCCSYINKCVLTVCVWGCWKDITFLKMRVAWASQHVHLGQQQNPVTVSAWSSDLYCFDSPFRICVEICRNTNCNLTNWVILFLKCIAFGCGPAFLRGGLNTSQPDKTRHSLKTVNNLN